MKGISTLARLRRYKSLFITLLTLSDITPVSVWHSLPREEVISAPSGCQVRVLQQLRNRYRSGDAIRGRADTAIICQVCDHAASCWQAAWGNDLPTTVSRGLSTPNVSHAPRSVCRIALNPKPLATPRQKYQTYKQLSTSRFFFFYEAVTLSHKQISLLHIKCLICHFKMWTLKHYNCSAWGNSTASSQRWRRFRSAAHRVVCKPFRSRVSQDVNVTWETRAVWAAVQNTKVPVQVLRESSGCESAMDLFWYHTFTARRGSQSKESYCHIQEAYITCLSWGSSSSCLREVCTCGFAARIACSYPVNHILVESVVRRFWYHTCFLKINMDEKAKIKKLQIQRQNVKKLQF